MANVLQDKYSGVGECSRVVSVGVVVRGVSRRRRISKLSVMHNDLVDSKLQTNDSRVVRFADHSYR